MKPLIEITTVPIQIEMKTTNAKLEYARGTAEMEISRDNGNLQIKSRPIKVNIDTFEARNSLSPTLARYLEQNAQKGRQAAYEATATYARQGQLLLEENRRARAFYERADFRYDGICRQDTVGGMVVRELAYCRHIP